MSTWSTSGSVVVMPPFDQRAADVSVDHADVVAHYRTAHAITRETARGESSTEEQRRAMVHYRALFHELLCAGADDDQGRSRNEREYARAGAGRAAAAPPPPPKASNGH